MGGEWGVEGEVAPDFNIVPSQVLWRYVLDTRSGSVVCTVVPGGESLDHAHVNPRFEGTAAARYVYANISNDKKQATSGPCRGYMRLDLLTGKREVWYGQSGRIIAMEPVIVEKAEARGNTKDTGDVWLLGMVNDGEDGGRSSLLVFDGARLADGPVCRIRLDHHVTHGLHGSFAPGVHASQ